METDNSLGQGLRIVTDPETGRSYPIPAGGSGNEPPPSGGDGSEGTVQGEGAEGVQPTTTEGGEPAGEPDTQGGEGQGFLEPYLSEVPEDQRPIVEPVLERYRQEQDARVNRRFEQLQEENRVPQTIYQSLLRDPVATVNWIAERMEQDRGVNLRDQLLQQWRESQNPEGQGQEVQSEETENKPLTQAELDRILEEREKQQKQQQQQQQFQQQQAQQMEQTVNGWIDSAAKTHNLPIDDGNGPDPIRDTIVMHANRLHEQGVARGQAAVEMAVEALAKRFGSVGKSNQEQGNSQPKTATGGTPPPGQDYDVSDPKQRKARMMELFPANQ